MDFIIPTKQNLYIGIDNGKQGGIVGIDIFENITTSTVMPIGHDGEYDINKIYDFFNNLNNNYTLNVCLEKSHTMPLNGGKANFTNGYQYGIINTVLQILKINYEICSARTWQKFIFQGDTVKDTKMSSINFCLKKWSHNNWKRTEKCSKYHDGLTDAACMALYCKRKLL
jgi:hypothetical protein